MISKVEKPDVVERHLILGGSGFIGRHVAALLVQSGHEVVLAGRSLSKPTFTPALEERVGWRSFDLANAQWDSLIDGITVIHHYAWSSVPASANNDPSLDLSTNVAPTLGLLEALRKKGSLAPRLIFASSGGTVYGKLLRVPVHEDHRLSPITAYGAGKAAVELYLGTYRALYGLDCRVARLANPFGAGQNLAKGLGAVTTFLHRALSQQPIIIWGDGEVVRDFIHISDVAAGLVALARAQPLDSHHVFNIGSGEGVSLNGVIAELESKLPHRLDVRYEHGRKFDVPVSVLDISLIRETLGWRPSLSFSEGLSQTLGDLGGGGAHRDRSEVSGPEQ
ncbi:NAD-dependent epimerase [Mesorhizobium sp. WSM4312]|uniref:NAD-dependent epimerase/dehydratase family protein n=1 Tax=Mesorhizobium sp. WSM4312 TaxID=2029411 RepID=UPI000BAF08D6|nr:NAD-dependent epimerase/dehydratase family protein [Mesorhizobium sp. WSM4312]PBB64785.1 NAD-dependent epimerase [Mesorhizobium sp. WSM4312]